MEREFNVVIEKDTDGYFVMSGPSLLGCRFFDVSGVAVNV